MWFHMYVNEYHVLFCLLGFSSNSRTRYSQYLSHWVARPNTVLLFFLNMAFQNCILKPYRASLCTPGGTRYVKKMIVLTHWGRVTHICVGNLTIIGSDNGLSPGRRQAITWTNVGILLIGPLGTNFGEMLSKFMHFHSRKSIWKCRLENGGHFVSASMC